MKPILRISDTPAHARSALAFLRHFHQRFIEDDCLRSAAALTYLTLFALVPLMTVAYAMLSAVPTIGNAGPQIQSFLFSHFVPSTGQEIEQYLQKFSNQARQLTGIGVVFLVVTAYGMLNNIERTLNAVWRAPNRKRGLRSFLLYWGILSLGPLFIGLAIGISTYLLSLRVFAGGIDIFGLKAIALRAMPMLLNSAAFALIYVAVPNCRVPPRHAVIGGLAAGVGFEIAKQIFALAVAHGYQRVYGTFAVLPLFLAWIYLSWTIVLAGAELVYALSGYASRHTRHISDLLIAVAVLARLWQSHQRGVSVDPRALARERWLLGRYPLPIERWSRLRTQLTQAGLIKTTEEGDFLLGRDLHQMTLWQLAELLGHVPPGYQQHVDAAALPWLARYQGLLEQWRSQGREGLDLPLAELFATPATAVAAGAATGDTPSRQAGDRA